MTAALDRATAALGNANVKAFLHVIREGESNQGDDSYRLANVGGLLAQPGPHPWYGQTTTAVGHSTAFGAYQFLGTSFKEASDGLGLGNDCSPINQDLCAVWTIDVKRHALAAVENGQLAAAVALLEDEWVSLPHLGLERVQRVFLAFGGAYSAAPIDAGEAIAHVPAQPDAPVAPSAPAASNQPENSMFAMLLPAILQLVPQLIGIFGKGGERAGQNQAAAQAVSDALIKAVPGAAGLGDAVEKATKADAATQQQIQAAVVSDTSVKAMLDAVAPTLDKIALYDAATNAAQIAGADAAQARSVKDKWDMTKTIVIFAGATSTIVVLGLLGTILYQATTGDRTIDTALVGLAGPLLAIAMKVWGDIFSYRFDGSPTANAANAANQVIATAIPKQQ